MAASLFACTYSLVLNEADGKRGILVEIVPVHFGIATAHTPVVGALTVLLRGAPPVPIVTNVVEAATTAHTATREGRKAVPVVPRPYLSQPVELLHFEPFAL